MARKVFRFALEIDGVDQLLIQDVKKPVKEIGKVVHGGENGKEIKTAGGQTISDGELQKIKPADVSDTWAWDLMEKAAQGLPADYKFDAVFKEYAPDGITTLTRWLWEGVWVFKTDDSNYKRGNQNENVIETVSLSVDDVTPIK